MPTKSPLFHLAASLARAQQDAYRAADPDTRWPGGVNAAGQPLDNEANTQAVASRRAERLAKATDTAPSPSEAASEPDTGSIAQRYARAEAASAVVKEARRLVANGFHSAHSDMVRYVTAYERLLAEGE